MPSSGPQIARCKDELTPATWYLRNPSLANSLGYAHRPSNTSTMRNLSIFTVLLFCAFAATSYAQDPANNWIPADDETIPLEPASLHAARVYHPAAGGGDMHVQIDSRYPVTVAMAWADEWNAAMQHPEVPAHFSFLCMREHVTSTIYECHLPSERPMIGVILGPGARQFMSPNDLHIQYFRFLHPEFHWRRILNEKYQITPAPKVYSLMTPDHDGQELSVHIKSPIPLTLALLPSHLADQVYDKSKPAARNVASSQ